MNVPKVIAEVHVEQLVASLRSRAATGLAAHGPAWCEGVRFAANRIEDVLAAAPPAQEAKVDASRLIPYGCAECGKPGPCACGSRYAPTPAQRFNLFFHLRRQREWSERTFGPGARTAGVVDHIRKELREIEAAPSDVGEWIDVAILAFDGAWRAGVSPEDIVVALAAKQAKNEARVWPDWRTMPADKAIEHDRSRDAQEPGAPGREALPEDDAVRTLCARWGYGAVMASAARQWAAIDPVGALAVGPVASLATPPAAKEKNDDPVRVELLAEALWDFRPDPYSSDSFAEAHEDDQEDFREYARNVLQQIGAKAASRG